MSAADMQIPQVLQGFRWVPGFSQDRRHPESGGNDDR
jgi:hypothetical protein